MMTNNIIGGMRKNMANENKEKLVRKPGKKKTGIRKRENSNTNGYLFMLPYALMFVVFILLPTVLAVVLSFTNFNAIQFPKFVGFLNYITLITSDEVFMQYVLPNTVLYAVVVGIGGYILSFVLAWALCNLTKVPRTIFALILYSPSMTAGVAMTVLWKVIFSGDQTGLLNAWLMNPWSYRRTYHMACKYKIPFTYSYYHRSLVFNGCRFPLNDSRYLKLK